MAQHNAELARSEERKAQDINEFLQAMLASPDPANMGKEVTVLQVLDRAGRLLENDQSTDPPTRAAMENAIGGAYFGLGQFAEAEPHLKRAMELQLAHAGPESLAYAEALGSWGGWASTMKPRRSNASRWQFDSFFPQRTRLATRER